MPRGFKCRRVCSEPQYRTFAPEHPCEGAAELTVEELEAVRLCDREGLEQNEAAERMNVSRATFQRILYEGRYKIADALCTGKVIRIGGGNYEVAQCGCGCRKACMNCRFTSDGN